MKAKGPKHERETVIVYKEEGSTASVWTTSEVTYRRLKKMDYQPFDDNDMSATFEVPKRDIKLPRPKAKMSDKQRDVLKEG